MSTLDAARRKALPSSDFAIPEKAPGPGSYPIEDKGHAIDAEGRAEGKPVQGRVDAAVHRKFPNLGGNSQSHNSSTRGTSNPRASTQKMGK